ncbi:MAG: FAD-dependent oxidoreductase [Candidatus Latescibacterota bacterium]|nr:MAG: FAD-dependent oxidoreductase [Candidatus Latescibacterota bacterium]
MQAAAHGVRVEIPDRSYWKGQIQCQAACPVHTDARGYVRAIAEGNDELAYLIARGPNPMASICGRICGAPCELDCRRGELDRPIAIRALKRFACERFGPESRAEGGRGLTEFLKQAARKYAPRSCEDSEELLPLLQSLLQGEIPKAEGRSVGIIGSGPAGLACAHDLALFGFDVTIYEAEPVLAGMLAVGVPEYRLPRDLIRAEVEVIQEMGVKAVTSCSVGHDVSLAELRKRHDAVLVAVGLKRSRRIDIPGADAEGVLGGVEFLRDVSLGHPPALGRRVVVVGGGNVAYDVGRTVLRQISLDAARTAVRESGVRSVYLCSLESLEEMPADDVEILEGDEEGIIRRNSLGPVEILKNEAGRVRGVLFRRCLRVYDEQRRFAPKFDDNQRDTIECDNVVLSVGQAVDLSFLDPERDGIETTERGLVHCDPESGRTSAADVWIAGDLAYGPKLLIHAVASGKRVARDIYEMVTGRRISHRDTELHFSLRDYRREPGYEMQRRVAIPTSSVSERLRSQAAQVETGYTEEQARLEASRCLDCGVNTIFDGNKCILCGGCVDVCPSLCLRIVSADRLHANGALLELLDQRLDGMHAAQASAIVKDETICIRCGLCAERCPTGAITMERFMFKEIPQCQLVSNRNP